MYNLLLQLQQIPKIPKNFRTLLCFGLVDFLLCFPMFGLIYHLKRSNVWSNFISLVKCIYSMFESEGLVIPFSAIADRLSVLTSTFLPFRLIFIGCFCVLASKLLSFISPPLRKENRFLFRSVLWRFGSVCRFHRFHKSRASALVAAGSLLLPALRTTNCSLSRLWLEVLLPLWLFTSNP